MSENEMKIAYFREFQSTSQCELCFHLNIKITDKLNLLEEIKAVRQIADTTASLEQHIKNKIQKIIQDELKEQNENKPDNIHVCLKRGTKKLKSEAVLRNLIKEVQENITLEVLDQKFLLIFNAPLVKEIRLPSVIYANFSVQPTKFISMFTNTNKSDFSWHKSLDRNQWTKVGETYVYKVQEDDVDHYLKLVCVPFNAVKVKGPPYEVISEKVVQRIPEIPTCPFEQRHQFTKEPLNNSEFRVISYNILSERYAEADKFPYCSPEALCMDYRKQLLLKELLGYNSDIVCLQEVDFRHYKNYFKHHFNSAGYGSAYYKKGNRITEGLACIYKKSKFKEMSRCQIVLSDEIKTKAFAYLWNIIKDKTEIKNYFLKQATSLQITVLKNKNNNSQVIVGNTHLFYHPDAGYIRLLQINLITTYLNRMRIHIQKLGFNVSVIICGDFNSNPDSSVYSYLTTGKIHPNNEDCLKLGGMGKVNLYHQFNFESACGTPKYTNYTNDFKACLDYIFIDCSKLKLVQMIPLIAVGEVEEYEGFPNEVFPSDHLALVADLKFL